MLKRIKLVSLILLFSLTLVGCGTSTGKAPQENPGTDQTPTSSTQQESKPVQLTPAPSGTPVVEANGGVSKQIMAQKDVLGTQIYDQQGIVFGDITFKSGVSKDYAHNLADEFLTQLKVSYPNREIKAQVVIDGKTTDSISFKP